MSKFFSIVIICTLLFPIYTFAEETTYDSPVINTNMEELAPDNEKENNINNEVLTNPTVQASSQYKQPYSRKKLAKKFIIAMLCVAGASVFLYMALSVYNKIREGFISSVSLPPDSEKPLDVPQDLEEAVKTFIDKTKWQG